MTVAEQFDMPFVIELPKREQSRWQKIWGQYQDFKKLSEEKGCLVPLPLAAKLAGVSPQRINELCDGGQIERIRLHGHAYVVELSFLTWARSERKAGRPPKGPGTAKEVWKVAREYGKEAIKGTKE